MVLCTVLLHQSIQALSQGHGGGVSLLEFVPAASHGGGFRNVGHTHTLTDTQPPLNSVGNEASPVVCKIKIPKKICSVIKRKNRQLSN